MNSKNDTFALTCILILSVIALWCGFSLILRGFEAGQNFATIASSGLSGIVGYIGGKAVGRNEAQREQEKTEPPAT